MPVITTSVQNMAGSTEQRINKELKDKNCDTDFFKFSKKYDHPCYFNVFLLKFIFKFIR